MMLILIELLVSEGESLSVPLVLFTALHKTLFVKEQDIRSYFDLFATLCVSI